MYTVSRVLFAACVVFLFWPLSRAQSPSAADAPETASHDTAVTFESKVNLVPIPVVVRDKNSHALGGLTKDDFQIFDNGKPQVISRFSVEMGGGAKAVSTAATSELKDGNNPGSPPTKPATAIPTRFVAYVFDDLHLNNSNLMEARAAALKHFGNLDSATTRAAVFTTSGIGPEDFTSDRTKLEAALNHLIARSRQEGPQTACPYINYYLADLLVNHNDVQAMQDATAEAFKCTPPPQTLMAAQSLVRANAFVAASIGENETRAALGVLKNMVKRVAAMPGQRTLVLVSPGFLFPTQVPDMSELIDLSIRMNVVISAVDARGLYVDARFDGSRSHVPSPQMAEYETQEARAGGEALGALAEGTGGTLFQNSNDLLEGFRRAGSPPEVIYMLGFSPQNLKNDGKFHSIKVKLKNPAGSTVQARRGYFAPKHAMEAGEQTRQEIDEALFSREEMKDFPLSVNTQFFKSSENAAKVSIVSRVGLKTFRFRKADGRNNDQLTLVAGLFDRDGNYLTGKQTTVDLHFRDETLARHINNGVAIRSSFDDVKPGTYVVRVVCRDAEGQMIAAANGSVEVP